MDFNKGRKGPENFKYISVKSKHVAGYAFPKLDGKTNENDGIVD